MSIDLKKMVEYTVDDIMNLPEGERAELIDGVWYDMAAPLREHQEIVSVINTELSNHIRKKGGSCRVYPAPFAVFLNQDNRNYLEPDVTVVCDPGKLDKYGCKGAPDLVVEVTSPTTKDRDYAIKLFKYRDAGVKEYWIINPDSKTINTYSFSDEAEERVEKADQISFDEELTSSLYPDFSLTLSELLK